VTWLFWLGLAVIMTAVVAVMSIQPKGTRSIGHTHMMTVARVALAAVVVILGYVAFRARSGG